MRLGETITSYAGNYVYKEDNTGEHLEFFNHPEGYVQAEMVANTMSFDYVYQYKDHLGNIRLSYDLDEANSVVINEDYSGVTADYTWAGGTNISHEAINGELHFSALNRWKSISKYIDVVPNKTVHIEFDFKKGDMQVPILFIKEKINGVWESNADRDRYILEDGHFEVDLNLQGEHLRIYFEKGTGTDNGTMSTCYIDNLIITQNSLEIVEENNYYPFGGEHEGYNNIVSANSNSVASKYQYSGKEIQDELGLDAYDFGARMYDANLGRFMSIDPHSESYYNWTPYNYVANNPLLLIDPDGKDWFYYSKNGKDDPTWNWHDGSEYNTGVKDDNGNDVILQGVEAVVVFNGSVNEKLGTKKKGDKGYDGKHTEGYMDGDGAVTASVTVYGPGGADDVQEYTGYTMSSDPCKYGVCADGIYDANYDKKGKSGALKSNWTLNERGRIPTFYENNPYRPNQRDENGAYLTGVFIHRSNNSGWAGGGVSKGCLLISPADWKNFNKQMKGVKNFKVQVRRKELYPTGNTTTISPWTILKTAVKSALRMF